MVGVVARGSHVTAAKPASLHLPMAGRLPSTGSPLPVLRLRDLASLVMRRFRNPFGMERRAVSVPEQAKWGLRRPDEEIVKWGAASEPRSGLDRRERRRHGSGWSRAPRIPDSCGSVEGGFGSRPRVAKRENGRESGKNGASGPSPAAIRRTVYGQNACLKCRQGLISSRLG